MISADQERYILAQAYVPEHIVGLMSGISCGEPFLGGDYLATSNEINFFSWTINATSPQRKFIAGKGYNPSFIRMINVLPCFDLRKHMLKPIVRCSFCQKQHRRKGLIGDSAMFCCCLKVCHG